MFPDEKRKEYLQLFLSRNKDFEVFKGLLLFSRVTSWSGSEVPIIKNKIEFLNSLLSMLSGLEYLEHKQCIEDRISKLKKYMEETEIDEIIRGI